MVIKTEISRMVQEKIKHKHQEAIETASRKRAEIYDKIPELMSIDSQMAKLAMGIAPAALSADGVEIIASIRKKMDAISTKKRELMASYGYSPEDLMPRFNCKKCEDTGFFEGKRCMCWEKYYREESYSRLPEFARNISFASFDLNYYPEKDENGRPVREIMQKTLNLCRQYCKNIGESTENLLFIGKTGLGKTHLSLSILTQAASDGVFVKYVTAQSMIDVFERTRFNRNPTPEHWELVNDIQSAQLLVIDDLGSEFVTSFSQSVLYNIINDRMANGYQTVISTNLEPSKLDSVYEQRLTSRLLGNCTALGFFGKDIRTLKRLEKNSK